MTREQFVKKYYPTAVSLTKGTGIFPEIMISQAILESSKNGNPGESLLSKLGNNYFGIKDSAQWTGPTITLQTGEYYNGVKSNVNGVFRKYESIEDSMRDYVKFLLSNPRYKAAGVFTAITPAKQAEALQAAGYATDPRYSYLVVSIINSIKKWFKDIPPIAFGTTALLITATIFFLIFNKR